VTTTAAILFWSSLCSAVSYLVAVPIAARFGLINTMVFTHLPSSASTLQNTVALPRAGFLLSVTKPVVDTCSTRSAIR
jgi:hypothetical protein